MCWCIHQVSKLEAVESLMSLMLRSESNNEKDINNNQQVKTIISKLFFNINVGIPNQRVGAFTRQAIRM